MREDIIVVDGGFEAIPAGLKQGVILARNGLFILRRLHLGNRPFIEVVKKLGPGYEAEGMVDCQESLALHAPKIGRTQLQEVESFFRKVYRDFHGEAVVFLYFSLANGGKWKFAAVPQEVSEAGLKWKTPGPPPSGWYLAGSFHSHPGFGASHSPTDDGDEVRDNWDGIHVTVGKIMSPSPEYAASIVLGGQRFEISIEDIVEPAEEVGFPEGWMEQVSRWTPPAQPGLLGRKLVVGGEPTKLGKLVAEYGGEQDER